jgi:hypothetical protein
MFLYFRRFIVSLDCGFSWFAVAETELRLLREGIESSTAA